MDTRGVEQLSLADLPALQALYASAYPGNWFDPRMLETGCYYGLRRDGEIVSVAGVHVYSPRHRAAALGNITTHPAYRGQGLCTAVTARLCQGLRSHIDFIGLNVLVDNPAAIHCYEKLGFTMAGEYEEFMIE
jgi:predicted GNAT family acetyltransferase